MNAITIFVFAALCLVAAVLAQEVAPPKERGACKEGQEKLQKKKCNEKTKFLVCRRTNFNLCMDGCTDVTDKSTCSVLTSYTPSTCVTFRAKNREQNNKFREDKEILQAKVTDAKEGVKKAEESVKIAEEKVKAAEDRVKEATGKEEAREKLLLKNLGQAGCQLNGPKEP